jgi:hypothetical protein
LESSEIAQLVESVISKHHIKPARTSPTVH